MINYDPRYDFFLASRYNDSLRWFGMSACDPLRTSAGSAERTRPLSEIDLFGELQGVINFDAEVADSAFEFAVTKK